MEGEAVAKRDAEFIQKLLDKLRGDKRNVGEVLAMLPGWLQEWVASPQFLTQCDERFDELDVDNSGTLEPRELMPCVKEIAQARTATSDSLREGTGDLVINDDHCDELCQMFDVAGTGALDKAEFF